MTRLYELSLEAQTRKLRNTAIAALAIGLPISYDLLTYHHRVSALVIAIITLQVAIGSLIIRSDIEKDLRHQKENDGF